MNRITNVTHRRRFKTGAWRFHHLQRQNQRHGVVLICMLVCLIVASSLVVATVANAMRGQRETRRRHQAMQTQWLLIAGIDRAVNQIQADPNYQGENWIPKAELPDFAEVKVQITLKPIEPEDIESEDNPSDAVAVDVVAMLSQSDASPAMKIATRTQKSYSFKVSKTNLPSPTTNEE
ncbi:hypothetical protein SH528x_003963 [Novipirellula sp. SH528]|uniref:hypothetical protein n=1 Tax=Novipirellula sp. SH528 TaxID=3454466 RepID=UPI003FA13EF5